MKKNRQKQLTNMFVKLPTDFKVILTTFIYLLPVLCFKYIKTFQMLPLTMALSSMKLRP